MEKEQNLHSSSSILDEHMENYNIETSALHRKLQSKVEALKIMREQLETFRTERDQFKLMAETLQLRYSALKRDTDYTKLGFDGKSSVLLLLNDTREKNIKLTTDVESLRQKLTELQGDIKLLRTKYKTDNDDKLNNKQNNIQKQLTIKNQLNTDELDWKMEKSNFIQHLETLKKKNTQLSFDLKAILDEKEEAVTERDAYKCKAHRLNHELQIALKLNESHPTIMDIDGLILENKYLQEKLKNCENELKITHQCVTKYKSMLETKRKKGIIKLGTNNATVMSRKQVKTLLDNGPELPSRAETIADLKSLCLALLDNLNDKILALNHQKKTNKILAARITELEKRIQLISNDCIETKTEINATTTFSLSEILLNGYCSSTVDCEPKSSNNTVATTTTTDDSGTISSDESNKLSSHITTDEVNENLNVYKTNNRNDCCNNADEDNADDNDDDDDDDGMDSLSSADSNRSIISSEYGVTIDYNQIKSIYALNDTKIIQNNSNEHNNKYKCIKNINNSPLTKERLNDMKDLPPELAEMVQKALEELDLKEEIENNKK